MNDFDLQAAFDGVREGIAHARQQLADNRVVMADRQLGAIYSQVVELQKNVAEKWRRPRA